MPKKVLIIFGLSLVVISALIMFLFSGENEQNGRLSSKNKIFSNATAYANWDEEYRFEVSDARGLSLFDELLNYRTKKTSGLISTKLDSAYLDSNATYLFIGKDFFLNDNEFDSLIDRVQKGANLFLSYENLSSNIYERFFSESGFMWNYSPTETIENNNKYKLSYVFQEDTLAHSWNFFNQNVFETGNHELSDSITYLSFIENRPNFVSYHVGRGRIFLHANPFVFQNYQLVSDDGFSYAQWVSENIPSEHSVYWLELARYKYTPYNGPAGDEGSGETDNSVLSLIYESKALMTAFLLALAGLLLFLLFRIKRSQRFVPYLPKQGNQSLAFAETIKEIYYKQQTPYSILQVMKRNFYTAVNKQFFIDLNKQEKNHELKLLAEKSGFSLEQIKELINLLETKVQSQVDYHYIERTSKKQQEFYRHSGIIKAKLKHIIDNKTIVIHRLMLLPILFVSIGLASILAGFYLLHVAESIGILLWPIGLLLTFFGIRWYQLPLMKIEEQHLVFYSLFRAKKRVPKESIVMVAQNGNQIIFETESKEIFQISTSEASRFDLQKLEQFIFPLIHNTL